MPQSGVERRSVNGNQSPVKRVFLLGLDMAADQITHQHRHQRDRKASGGGHCVGLGVRQGREQPSFLRFQSEYRQEGNRHHQEREETGSADFCDRDEDGAAVISLAAGAFPLFEFLVDLLDHHDGRVNQRPDRDGDAAQ